MVSHHFSEYLICFNYEPAFLKVKDLPPKSLMEKPIGFEGILPGQCQERRPRSSIMRVFEQQMFFFWMFLSDQHALSRNAEKLEEQK